MPQAGRHDGECSAGAGSAVCAPRATPRHRRPHGSGPSLTCTNGTTATLALALLCCGWPAVLADRCHGRYTLNASVPGNISDGAGLYDAFQECEWLIQCKSTVGWLLSLHSLTLMCVRRFIVCSLDVRLCASPC